MAEATRDTGFRFREDPAPADEGHVRRIIESSGFFSSAEVDVAVELVTERLQRGMASGYRFVFADDGHDAPVGYTCYGEIPCTVGSFDLYWIAVHEGARGGGLGGKLLRFTEDRAREAGARRMYIETSGRELYRPTQGFYLNQGYHLASFLQDFYGVGDAKLTYLKTL